MSAMIEQVLAATQVSHHFDVRSRMERRSIPVIEEDALETVDSAENTRL